MIRKSNLFVIGAMKSGTTSLCQYLATHPDIFMVSVKEPMHFSREENWSQGHETYLRLFADANKEMYIGEGSTEYSKRPFREGVAQRIYEFNSSAQIVYVLRDPFDRIVSQHKHMVKTENESRSLREIIQNRSDYLTNSYYAYQIRPYLKLFGRESVYLDTFEALKVSPASFCKRLFCWLGIDSDYVPPTLNQRFNVSPTIINTLDGNSLVVKLLSSLKRVYAIDTMTPRAIRKLIKKVIPQRITDFESTEIQDEIVKIRAILQPLLSKWIDELEKITGYSYDIWPIKKLSSYPLDLSNILKTVWLPEEIKSNL